MPGTDPGGAHRDELLVTIHVPDRVEHRHQHGERGDLHEDHGKHGQVIVGHDRGRHGSPEEFIEMTKQIDDQVQEVKEEQAPDEGAGQLPERVAVEELHVSGAPRAPATRGPRSGAARWETTRPARAGRAPGRRATRRPTSAGNRRGSPPDSWQTQWTAPPGACGWPAACPSGRMADWPTTWPAAGGSPSRAGPGQCGRRPVPE